MEALKEGTVIKVQGITGDVTVIKVNDDGLTAEGSTEVNGVFSQVSFNITDIIPAENNLFPVLVAPEVAVQEVNRWLDYKRVKPTKRMVNAEYIQELVQGICYGDVTINANNHIIHKLNFPILDKTGGILFDKLEYVPNLTAQKVNECVSAVGNSQISMTIAYGAALSGKAVSIIGLLDTTDLAILASVGVFFT